MTRSGLPFFLSLLVLCLPVHGEQYLAGPERPISVARQGLAATGHPASAASTPNGDRSILLLTWNDVRGGQAMRLSSSGKQLDPHPITLPIGTQYVFWREDHWVVTSGPGFVRIDESGKLLDRIARQVTYPAPRPSRAIAEGMGWCGSAAVMVVSDWDRKYFYAWTFDRDMNFVAEKAIAPYATKGYGAVPQGFASDGTSALFVYKDEQTNDLNAVLFDRYGEIARHESVQNEGRGGGAVGTSGNGYAVIHPLEKKGLYTGFVLDHELHRRTIPSFGVELDEWVTPWYDNTLPFDGTAFTFYFAAYVKGGAQLYATRISPQGKLLEGPAPVLKYRDANYPHYFHAGATDGLSIVLYGDPKTIAGDPAQFLKARIAATPAGFESAPELDLPLGAFPQGGFSAASSTTLSLVAWKETFSPDALPAIFATRVDAQANVLDPQSIPLGLHACREVTTAAASDGRDFLALWQDAGGMRAAIVRANGTTTPVTMPIVPNQQCAVSIQDGPLVTYGYPSRLEAISNGSIYLAVSSQYNPKQKGYDVSAIRIAANGTVLDEVPIAVVSEAPAVIQIATDGRDFLVMHGTRATRVGADGAILDRSGLRLGGVGHQVWWDGTSYAAVIYDDDAKVFRLRRLGSDGSGAYAAGELPPPELPRPQGFTGLGARTFRCDARGCSFAMFPYWDWNTLSRNDYLVVTRAERKGDTYELSVTPIAGTEFFRPQYWNHEGPTGCVLTGATSSLLVCTRRSLDAPYHGIERLFVRPLWSGPRTRVVRH